MNSALDFLKDGGWLSRKLGVTLFSLSLVTLITLLVGKYQGLVPVYGTFCSTVVGLVSIYIGGNSALKWIYAKNSNKETPPKEP